MVVVIQGCFLINTAYHSTIAIMITRAEKPIATERKLPGISMDAKNPMSPPKRDMSAKLLVPAKARPPNWSSSSSCWSPFIRYETSRSQPTKAQSASAMRKGNNSPEVIVKLIISINKILS